jgi:hypothetical protein
MFKAISEDNDAKPDMLSKQLWLRSSISSRVLLGSITESEYRGAMRVVEMEAYGPSIFRQIHGSNRVTHKAKLCKRTHGFEAFDTGDLVSICPHLPKMSQACKL